MYRHAFSIWMNADSAQIQRTRHWEHDARALAARIDDDTQVVLLGSVASGKYVDILLPVFGDRLRFPAIFAGLGDMSRGGLLLRAARADRELEYTSLTAPRHKSLFLLMAQAWTMLAQQAEGIEAPTGAGSGEPSPQTTH